MMKKWLRSAWPLRLLAILIVPAAFAGTYAPGHPCYAEQTLYYSDATHSVQVGADQIFCDGRYVWGEHTDYYQYQYLGPCCSYCVAGSCGIEP